MTASRNKSSHRVVCVAGSVSAAVVLLCCTGCSKSPLEMVPVSGRITMDDGPLPVSGMIWFVPLDVPEGLPMRPAASKFETDGEFSARSFEPGDGLVPGRYRIWIQCLKEPISIERPEGVSYIDTSYEWPELVIERGTTEAVVVNYDVPANPKYIGQPQTRAEGPVGGMQDPRRGTR